MRSEDKTPRHPDRAADQLLEILDLADGPNISPIGERIRFTSGSLLIKAGEKPTSILIHRSGNIKIFSSCETALSDELRSSDHASVYGLIEILSGGEYRFSVTAVTDVEFFVLTEEDLFDRVRDQPDSIHRLSVLLSSLYRANVCDLRNLGEPMNNT
jgi:CRP-like cAMP-binding protein